MEARTVTYLDTHAVIWLYAGNTGAFPEGVLAEIETAELVVSPAVLLEIQFLQEVNRITAGPEPILAALRREIELRICEIPFYEVVRASYDESWTRDPFDRLIVAHAKAGGGKLISKDRRIRGAYEQALW